MVTFFKCDEQEQNHVYEIYSTFCIEKIIQIGVIRKIPGNVFWNTHGQIIHKIGT